MRFRAVTGALCAVLAALVVVSRRPDAVLHATFWAEDGWRWYPDAYELGWSTLLRPWTGYLQTISRLVALLVQPFPLAWAPTLFAMAAIAVQAGAAVFLVSDRMAAAWPGQWARALFALIYLLLPNSSEVHANLTNTHWHLAFLAFLVLASAPPRGWGARMFDGAVLVLSGLSGPFCLFLAPVALWRLARERSREMLWRAGIVCCAGVVQAGFILGQPSRPPMDLGAGPRPLAAIIALQVVFGTILGRHALPGVLKLAMWRSGLLPVGTALGALILAGIAVARGADLVRWACLAGALVFAAALASPAAPGDTSVPPWTLMSGPDFGNRYFMLPMLAWIGVLFAIAADRHRGIRMVGAALLGLLLIRLPGDWQFRANAPFWGPTDFIERARAFAAAPAGTRAEFPLHPMGVPPMTLVKR